jgi:hypothetical protein|tara:strand:+ start:1192 stop:1416 length:225 start_codon:yes stop_codon:yes gene_type:complete
MAKDEQLSSNSGIAFLNIVTPLVFFGFWVYVYFCVFLLIWEIHLFSRILLYFEKLKKSRSIFGRGQPLWMYSLL